MEVAKGQPTVASIFSIWFKNEWPEDADAAMESINAFIRRTDEPIPEKRESDGKIPWDFLQDADAIVTAFQKEYGIDITAERMHWWRFMALLEGCYALSFEKRVQYRTMDLSGMDSKQRSQILKLRNKIAIHDKDEMSYEDIMKFYEENIKEGGGKDV